MSKKVTPKSSKKAPKTTPLFAAPNPAPAAVELDEDELDELEEEEEGATLQAEPQAEIDVEKLIKEAEKNADFDIFTDLGDQLARKGVAIRYAVFKFNEFQETAKHPMDWDTIQKKYGGGSFRVTLKTRDSSGRWVAVKNESRDVAELQEPTDSLSGKAHLRVVPEEGLETKPPQTGPTDSLSQFKILQDIIFAERRATREDMSAMQPRETGTDNMAMFMRLFESQQAASNRQMEMFQTALKESNQANREMIKDLASEIKEISRGSKKEDGFGLKEALVFMRETESRADEKRRREEERLDKIKRELREELRESGGDEKEEKGIGSKLLEGLLPVLGPVIKDAIAKSRVPALPQAESAPAPVHQASAPVVMAPAPVPAPVKPSQAASIPTTAKKPEPTKPQAVPLGRIKYPPNVPKTDATTSTQAQAQGGAPNVSSDKMKQAVEKVVEFLTPTIEKALISREDPKKTAETCTKLLQGQNVQIPALLDNMSAKDLCDIAHRRGVPSLADPWFNDFYAALQTLSGRTGPN